MDGQGVGRWRAGWRRLKAAVEARLPRHGLTRNALVASSGHLTGYVVLLLATPLLTRLYSVADFGVYTIYTTLLAFVGLMGTLRYEGAIPLSPDETTSRRVLALALLVCCGMSLLAGLLLWAVGRPLLVHLGAAELADYGLLFALQVWACGWTETLTGWMIRRGSYGLLAQARFFLSTITALAQLAGALLWPGPRGLVLGGAAGFAAGLLYLLVGLRHDLPGWREMRLAELWSVAVRYRRFPQYSVVSALVQRTTLLLPPLALALLYNQTVVGWFGKGLQLLIVPLSLVGLPLSRVYMGEASRIHREGTGSLRRLFARTLRKQLLWAGIPLVAFTAVAPWTFQVILGKGWREAGVYCGLLGPMLVLYTMNLVLTTTLDVLERLELQLRRSLVGLACLGVGVLVPLCWPLPARVTILLFSVVNSVGYLYALWTTWQALPADAPAEVPAVLPAPSSRERRPAAASPGMASSPRRATVQSHV